MIPSKKTGTQSRGPGYRKGRPPDYGEDLRLYQSELGDTLAKLLTPKEPSVETVIAAIAEMSP
jgi:hypothetical protein